MSGLGSVKKAPTPHEPRDAEDDAFRHRLAMQQFLKFQTPILAAFAERAPLGSVDEGTFEKLAGEARDLAFRLASVVLDRPSDDIPMQSARHFRREASIIVASAWKANGSIDPDMVEKEVGRALLDVRANPAFNLDEMDWAGVTPEASRLLSRISMATSIASTVASTYAYRRDRTELTRDLCDLVDTATEDLVTALAAEHGRKSDHTIRQTVSRNLASVLCSIYRRQAGEFLRRVIPLDREARTAAVRKADPISTIGSEFRAWSEAISSMTREAGRAALKDDQPAPGA